MAALWTSLSLKNHTSIGNGFWHQALTVGYPDLSVSATIWQVPGAWLLVLAGQLFLPNLVEATAQSPHAKLVLYIVFGDSGKEGYGILSLMLGPCYGNYDILSLKYHPP